MKLKKRRLTKKSSKKASLNKNGLAKGRKVSLGTQKVSGLPKLLHFSKAHKIP